MSNELRRTDTLLLLSVMTGPKTVRFGRETLLWQRENRINVKSGNRKVSNRNRKVSIRKPSHERIACEPDQESQLTE
jgi:hypothetical protein